MHTTNIEFGLVFTFLRMSTLVIAIHETNCMTQSSQISVERGYPSEMSPIVFCRLLTLTFIYNIAL